MLAQQDQQMNQTSHTQDINKFHVHRDHLTSQQRKKAEAISRKEDVRKNSTQQTRVQHAIQKGLFDVRAIQQQRIDNQTVANYSMSHAKTTINRNTYQNFARTSQYLHFDETQPVTMGSVSQVLLENATQQPLNESISSGVLEMVSGVKKMKSGRSNKQELISGTLQKSNTFSSMKYNHPHFLVQKTPHQCKSQAMVGITLECNQRQERQNFTTSKSLKIFNAKNPQNYSQTQEAQKNLELVEGSSTMMTSDNEPTQKTMIEPMSNLITATLNNNIKLVSLTHLTPANQLPSKKYDSIKSQGINKQSRATEADCSQSKQWQMLSHSHPSKTNIVMAPQKRGTHQIAYKQGSQSDSKKPSLVASDSKSDHLPQGKGRVHHHHHQGRIVKLNQSAFREQQSHGYHQKAQSPNQNHRMMNQRLLSEVAANDMLANSVKVTSAIHQFGIPNGGFAQTQHPVYQTIAKIGENHLLTGMSKIKNQYVQKSGHLMNQGFAKEEHAANLSTAYQSDAYYQTSGDKHRDISNYSNNSQYAQLTKNQLKTNSSGIMMQPGSGAPQNSGNGGIPAFIQRNNQPWHSCSTNPSFISAAQNTNSSAGTANTTTMETYLNTVGGSKHAPGSIVLPQILQQKELHQVASLVSNVSAVDVNRQSAGPNQQKSLSSARIYPVLNYIKKSVVATDQQRCEPSPEYFSMQGEQTINSAVVESHLTTVGSTTLKKNKAGETVSINYRADTTTNTSQKPEQRQSSDRSKMGGRASNSNQGGEGSSWQTATSRKTKTNKAICALESGHSHAASFMQPNNNGSSRDQSGAYELSSVKVPSAAMVNSNGSGGVFPKSMKSATTSGGGSAAKRTDGRLLHMTGTQEEHIQQQMLAMQQNSKQQQPKHDLSRVQYETTSANNMQRSMNFRRKPSKDVRANSAKWVQQGVNSGSDAFVHKTPNATRKKNIDDCLQSKRDTQPTLYDHKQSLLAQEKPQDFKLRIQAHNRCPPSPSENSQNFIMEEQALPAGGFQFSYDLGDEPDEEDDEFNNTDGEEEGEEEQDDILIVQGDDEELDHEDEETDSPGVRHRAPLGAKQDIRAVSDSSPSEKAHVAGVKGDISSKFGGFSPANKPLNVSQEEIRTQLYGGDIYLLGGSHFLMKGSENRESEDPGTNAANIFSQASTNTGSEMPYKSGSFNRQISQMKKRGNGRSRKRGATKTSKQLQKIQERNSINEAEEEETSPQPGITDITSQTELKDLSASKKQLPGGGLSVVTAGMTDKQRKVAIRNEFLARPPNQIVTLIKSPFATRDPYIFFPYPPFLGSQRDLPRDYSRIVQFTQEQLKPYCTPGFKVSDSTHTYNSVVNALKMAGFRHVTDAKYNICWTGLFRQGRLRNLNEHQHINHFAGSWAIGRKDSMWRNVVRMRRLHGKAFDIAPSTYIFPEDYKRWTNDRECSNFKNMYIMKPNAASCGKGIRVIGRKQNVSKRSGYIVSKYVSKPHLIKGYKYDLRLYVLVTSFDPLKIYMFKDGLVRLATVPYSTSKASLKQRFVHLTNYSVNKKADSYVKNLNSPSKVGKDDQKQGPAESGGDEATAAQEETVESKLSLAQLRVEYQKMGIDYNEIFAGIKDVCIKTVLAAEQPILQCMGGNKNKNACFEVYGFDVIIDAKLRPWLLEVNVSPSLSSSSPLDKQIKTRLLSDTLYLVGFRLIDRKQQELEKAKQSKQRLFGFDTQKKKKAALTANSDAIEPVASAENVNIGGDGEINIQALQQQHKEPTRSGATRSRQPISHNYAQDRKISAFNSFVSNDSHMKSDIVSAGLATQSYHQMVGASSASKTGSPNRKRAALAKLQPPKPWLKDLGEPSLCKGASAGNAGQSAAFGGATEGYVNLTENDLEILADYEEEQQRRGHFELLYPLQKNVDTYRSFLSSNRRSNVLLWTYLKQGAPMPHLANHFKFMHMQNLMLQQQQAAANAAASQT